jgi:hypothetical protein
VWQRDLTRRTDEHLDGFRKSPEFGPFLKAVRPYIDFIKEMRHYELTAVIGRRAPR